MAVPTSPEVQEDAPKAAKRPPAIYRVYDLEKLDEALVTTAQGRTAEQAFTALVGEDDNFVGAPVVLIPERNISVLTAEVEHKPRVRVKAGE